MFGNLRNLFFLLPFLVLGIFFGMRAESRGTRIIFLDVGQGDCTVIQHRGLNVLIDAGPASDGYDAGERRVLPALRELRVAKLDLVLLTHPDSDHIGGFAAVARRYRPGLVISPKAFQKHPALQETLRAGQVRDVSFVERSTLRAGELTIEIQTPTLELGEDDNEGSLFIRVAVGDHAAVFTGDAGIETELEMLGATRWRAQLLKAGHHGSRGSTGRGWLDQIRPNWVVASCGENNRYGHPHPETLARVRAAGAEFLRTDERGQIEFVLGDAGWKPSR